MKLKKILKRTTQVMASVYVVAATTALVTIVTDKATSAAAGLIVRILRDET